MIKEKPTEQTKQTRVCEHCVNVMSIEDYAMYNGRCQLCRGEHTSNLRLYIIYYNYEYDEEPCIETVIEERDQAIEVERQFRDESDNELNYVFVHECTAVYHHGSRYAIIPHEIPND